MALAVFRGGERRHRVKEDGSPATDPEFAIKRMAVDRIRCDLPSVSVLGEEARRGPQGDSRWTIDPIDGTAALPEGPADLRP
ncbi:inositol monophosphatase family protein [Streptomyces sp. NPDC059853]|uniref:inositol monophosphatase family protein n=1 Tax=Streptomyces sp. NPDC059853 TaxID=3346973 RepID=UPI00364BB2F7